MIVAGASSQRLAGELAEQTGRELATVEIEPFPDGERYVRIHDSLSEAIVVASTATDAAHVEALQLQDAAREAGAETVSTIVPYMGYARQDRSFESGEAVSSRAVARAISTGTDRVLTVNPHEQRVCEYFDVPTEAVDAAPLLARGLPDLRDPLFVSPDEGAIDMAEAVRDAFDDGSGETDYFVKTRHSGDEVDVEPSDADVADRDVVLVDDIIATGSTMSEAIALLRTRDVDRVFVCCVHPLLARDAYSKLVRAGVETIFGTDTIERPVSRVSVAPAVADAL